MEKALHRDEIFDKIDFTENPLPIGEYENCTFIQCNFSQTNLSNIIFIESSFTGCNLSMPKTNNTAFRKILFKDCKLLGVHFENCNSFLLELTFENCLLNLSSFYKLTIKNTLFDHCSLHEVDFTAANLTSSTFRDCELNDAIFDGTNLEKTDFRTAVNYSIDPEINRIANARFALQGIAGLLNKYDISIE